MSNSVRTTSGGTAPNAKRLLVAGFMAILAAGIGFGIRGGILANWAAEFGFTGAQLGDIGGASFTSFCFGIIVGGVVVDKIGYGKLIVAAFLFHMLSALSSRSAPPQDRSRGRPTCSSTSARSCSALANGTLEAVANPLVSTLFPHNRTHYLNILHASWPAGLVLGGLVGWILGDGMHVSWKLQLGLFLVPTALYGVAFFGQKFPKSEASAKGLSIGEMLREVGCSARSWRASWWACSSRINWAPFSRSSRGHFFTSAAWGYLAWARRVRPADGRRHQDEFLDRIAAAVRAVHHARAARRGRARHRQLDSEHHRQHPDAGARQDPVRVHLAADVLAALLRALHREAPQGLAR